MPDLTKLSLRQLKAEAENIHASDRVDGAALLAIDNEIRRRKAPKTELPNIHPADELAAIREEVKILNGRADELRDVLLKEGADLSGDQYLAIIKSNTRESLDRKAIEEAFGTAAIAPFLKKTTYKTVNLEEK